MSGFGHFCMKRKTRRCLLTGAVIRRRIYRCFLHYIRWNDQMKMLCFSEKLMVQAQKILSSDVMQSITYALYGCYIHFLKSNNAEIHTNLCTFTKGVSQILGLGIGTSITGKHADIVVTDDIVNLKDRISRAERERTKVQYKTSVIDMDVLLIPEHRGTKKMRFPSCRM